MKHMSASQFLSASPSLPRTLALLACALIGAVLIASVDALAHEAFAQALAPARNPFDMGMREGSGPPTSGFVAWVVAEQMRFERMLSGAVRAIEADASALWTLLGISFAYGVFHAAGPGHGKAVVASYMFANDNSLRRGIAISFMAAALQAVVAVLIVAVLAVALNATSARMKEVANLVELASYGAIALLGAWLVWRKGRALAGELRGKQTHHHGHGHHDHDHGHHDHAHKPKAHVHDEHCGHFHAPSPATLGDGFTWRGAIATVFAAGARPCSGAILVLVFALAQGIFMAGVASAFAMAMGTALTTSALAAVAVGAKGLAVRFLGQGSGGGVIVVRLLELAAALLVLFLGASLVLAAMVGR